MTEHEKYTENLKIVRKTLYAVKQSTNVMQRAGTPDIISKVADEFYAFALSELIESCDYAIKRLEQTS